MAIDRLDDPGGSFPRAWDHLGALVEDRGEGDRVDGVFDGRDAVRELDTLERVDEALGEQSPIRVVFGRRRERSGRMQ